MGLSAAKGTLVELIADHLCKLREDQIENLVETGRVLEDQAFMPEKDEEGIFGQFYAPFDWINEEADIVLIGITPGRHQAQLALKTLRNCLRRGMPVTDAARTAKQAASFEGEMRKIAAQLMNRFKLHKLFRLSDSAELFGSDGHRAHYTSLLRYPVLHWQTKKPKKGTPKTGWFDYSGGDSAFSTDLLARSIERDFEPEIAQFKNAWLVPFGPVPATALQKMAAKGLVDPNRVLPGLNHPSGTQRNRHKCQLNTSSDHSGCARNVGCETIRARSKRLEEIVADRLAANAAA
jgi:hypothetical protein